MTPALSSSIERLETRRVFGIGYAEASAIDGLGTIDTGGVFIRLTRYGDANLDGTVGRTDFVALARNFNRTGMDWKHGDFNYDGNVNLHDLNRLAANFGLSAAGTQPTAGEWSALARAVGIQLGYEVSRSGTLTITGTPYVDEIIVDHPTFANVAAQFPDAPRVRRVVIDAGAGDDVVEMRVSLPGTIIGGKGDDHIQGGARAELISGGAGNDTVDAGSGDDTVEGMAGDDNLTGSAGADVLLGGDGADQLWGGSGADTIRGGAGNDLCAGHDGNDLLYGDAGRDGLDGGAGHDRFKSGGDGAVDLIHTGPAGERDRLLDHDADDVIRDAGG
jgi:Ca2+-binding RTX toxin-like protein